MNTSNKSKAHNENLDKDNESFSFSFTDAIYSGKKTKRNIEINDVNLFEGNEHLKEKTSEINNELPLDDDMMDMIQQCANEGLFDDKISPQKDHCHSQSVKSKDVSSVKNYYTVQSVKIEGKNEAKTKMIHLKSLSNHELVTKHSDTIIIRLKGLWAETSIDSNDTVFLSVSSDSYDNNEGCYILGDSYNEETYHKRISLNIETIQNFLIVEPELLLSPSLIKGGFPCLRRAFFTEEFKLLFGNEGNKNMLLGIILHQLFENTFKKISSIVNIENQRSQVEISVLEKELTIIMKNYYMDIALLDLPFDSFFEQCKASLKQIMIFFNNFYISRYMINGIRINKFITSEHLYQSQVLGMKGLIDITLETSNDNDIKEVTPFELKTGFYQSNSDIMQVLVYCLILSDQLQTSSSNGLLYYLKKDLPIRVKATMNDIINVIVVRNNLAKYIQRYENEDDGLINIPKLYNNPRECELCYKKNVCKPHYDLCEKRTQIIDEAQKKEQSQKTLEQLISVGLNKKEEYFNYFYSIINNEQIYSNHYLRDQFLQKTNLPDQSDYSKYVIRSVIDKNHSFNIELIIGTQINDINLISTKKKNEEEEIVSQMNEIKDNFCVYVPKYKKLFKGILVKKNEDNLTINVLKYQLDSNMLKYLEDIVHEQYDGKEIGSELYLKNEDAQSKFTYKLMRGNLLTFCSNESDPSIVNMQRAIIYLDKPTYNKDNNYQSKLLDFIKEQYYEQFNSLNKNQKTAILKALIGDLYSLIIGFPGTGKTTLISLLIDILASMGKRVLITAHTHIAVDNILLKLKENNRTKFCRIGSNISSIQKDIQEYVISNDKFKSVEEWKGFINNHKVYATTALGITNKLLAKNKFDYCIVDEACQIFEPNLLGPLMLANKFILVGDPFQLKALIKGKNISTPTSLFERLLIEHPQMAVQLELQYRMNNSILTLSNDCVYENVIKCANESVATRKLPIDSNYFMSQTKNIIPWVRDIIDPERAVLLVDYSQCASQDFFETVMDSNEMESKIIYQVLLTLSSLKFNMNDLGILTPYKNQESLLKKSLIEFNVNDIFTIDKSQGIEKELIIISLVKTNTKTKLLKDIARINVAFTRPKSKLIILGLKDVLIEIEKISNYINLLHKQNWIYYLPKDCFSH